MRYVGRESLTTNLGRETTMRYVGRESLTTNLGRETTMREVGRESFFCQEKILVSNLLGNGN